MLERDLLRRARCGAGIVMMLGNVTCLAQPDDRPSRDPERAPTVPARTPAKPQAEPVTVPARPVLRPLITEILYAVPTGEAGDANGDGSRHVSGDEFIEIVNPHDAPVQMLGYTITDAAASTPLGKSGGGGGSGVRFVFPPFELPARGVIVVFNGNSATWAGPVGDSKAAPAKPDDKLNGAYVFTMRQSSQRAALGNSSDAVMLSGPDGKVVHRVRWGKAAEGAADPKIAIDEVAPVVSKGSIVRIGEGKDAAWRSHVDVDLKPFSPGAQIVIKPAAEPPAEDANPSPEP